MDGKPDGQKSHTSFLLGFCLLLTHEMDAIRCAEWAMFPVTEHLGEDAGYRAFTAAHVPLYALVLRGLVGGGGVTRTLVIGLDAFSVVHVALPLLRRNDPRNRFRSAFSWVLILGAGLCGALDLLRAGRDEWRRHRAR